MTIFILEDNNTFIETLGELLQHEGITDFKLFTDHNAFMNSLDEETDIVIMDHRLTNEMTALKLLPRIKSKNKNCFIIILSGETSGFVVKNYMNAGADRYVIKATSEMREEFIKFINQGIDEMTEFKKLKESIKRNGRKDH